MALGLFRLKREGEGKEREGRLALKGGWGEGLLLVADGKGVEWGGLILLEGV